MTSQKIVQNFEGISADQMYREHILDHYRNPRNKGEIKNAIHQHEKNPLCGDEIDMYLNIKKDRIKDVKFQGSGCAISQSSASILTDYIKGKNVHDVLKTLEKNNLQELVGIEATAMRVKCMMLSAKAVKVIIYKYLGDKHE